MDRPVNGLKNGEGEIVDADLLVNLLDTYRFGPFGKAYYVSAAEIAPKPETTPFSTTDNTTKVEDEEENDGSHSHGNKFVHGSTSSASSNPDPINLETTKSETGSNEETGSNDETGSIEETGYDLLEANSTNSLTTENETQQNEENHEIEEKEEEIAKSKSEEESNIKKLLTIPENYELYCPNCSACITRRVILKKRKREKKQTDEPVTEPDDESSDIDEIEPPNKVNPSVTQPKEDEEDKEEAEMFSCLACLKYFIRLGARFLQLDFIRGRPVKESGKDNLQVNNLDSKNSDTILSPPQDQPEQERFTVEVLKSTVYGGLTETITSLGVVSSAVASGSSTLNILALTIANMAGGLIVLAHNLQDLRNDRNSDHESDRYEKLLGKRANSRLHILIAILSYILFGLIPPLVYAFSFYETGIKNYKLISVFMVSLVCVILLGMVKVYVRKPVNVHESPRSYLKSAAYYMSITVASSGISYFVGNVVGDFIEKVGWFSLDRAGTTTMFDGIEPGFNPYGSF